ncbi:pentapeptide repeat-containing protein [Amycolatopsis sp. cmx-4-68]|uniref:pentapeptide repeat-containing protein n=1 Tax=Amycolatopsis sp. cmx-4-68 TaxID=2790938 RepID=UPI00397CDD1B
MTDNTTPPPTEPARVTRLRALSPKTMWSTAAVIAVLTAGAVVALWWPATAGLTGAELVTARLDALKIGLSIGVGSGGVVALYLAWRRQHSTEADLDNRERALAHQQEVAAATMAHQDRVARATEHDAVERRMTELHLKAVEQLGSDKAPVRLGGLYALERLAQDNESQRQTIVNVLCAYLRMPYDAAETAESEHRAQEREVRLTAQRLLRAHLRPDKAAAYWGPLHLDLTSARLVDFTLDKTRVGAATFNGATFVGDATFNRMTFAGHSSFDRTTFTHYASFENTAFTTAWFGEAVFESIAWFGRAAFSGTATFRKASFAESAWFSDATFAGGAVFDKANFSGNANFRCATLIGGGDFRAVTFGQPATFGEAAFQGPADFDGTKTGTGWFAGATLHGEPFPRLEE